MFPHPRYHGGNGRAGYRQNHIQMIAGALASLLNQESRPCEWYKAPPRPFRRGPRPYPRRPYNYGYPRPDRYQRRFPPRDRPWDWSPYALPRRGHPVAVGDRVPRRYRRDERETRQPRGSDPRGTQRGGPERSANDPPRNHRGGQCGGPARSAKEPLTPPKASRARADGGRSGKAAEKKSPTVVTVDKDGQERKWGPLSRTSAWKAGCFYKEMKGDAKVFLEKDGKRAEVGVEKQVGKGGPRFWFKEMKPEPPQQQQVEESRDDQPVAEEVVDESTTEESATEVPTPKMSEVDPQEIETGHKMWLSEKVTTLEKENTELKKALQEMETRLSTQENLARQAGERCTMLETAITQIGEQVQRQNLFNESVRASFTSLAEEVKKHQDNFREVGRIFQAHEEYIVKTGTAYQEMAQSINALVQDSENKTVWISSLVRDSQEKTQVLRQHQIGLQVQAEVIKRAVNHQPQHPPQQQGVTGTGPTVTEVDDQDTDQLDFLGGQNPNSGPPNIGPFGAANQIPQVPTSMPIVPRF